MKSKYDFSTKDKIEISYRAFVLEILINLGLSPSSKGTYYLRDLILLATRYKDDTDINLKELRKELAQSKHISQVKIKTNIDYAFKCRDIEKAETNFKDVFNFEYDIYFITAKSLITLIVSLIYNIEITEKE